MVFLDTDFYSGSMEIIQKDLSPLVQELLPIGCNISGSVPYLMCSDGVLKREILDEVESTNNKRYFRRLAFRRNPNMIQSEALLVKMSSKAHRRSKTGSKVNKSPKKKATKDDLCLNDDEFQVDHSYLASPYHSVMIAGLSLVAPNINDWISSDVLVRVAIVGLGAGLLPMFLHKHMPFGRIEVIELDPVIGDLAKRYFGFVEDDRMKLHIGDGLSILGERTKGNGINGQFISNVSSEHEMKSNDVNVIDQLHILIIDADSDDPSSGMSCPPVEFLEESFLLAAKRKLCEGGMLVINLVARAKAPHSTVPDKLKKVFAEVYSLEVDEDVNRVLFALPQKSEVNSLEDIVELAGMIRKLAIERAPWGNGPNVEDLVVKISKC
ncbi:hypothetical protein KP509_30G043900 [Ceratopteris richardii]|nr:hypothetical protein KP509_30G043900 [Ceratopteris richardii]